MKPHFVLLFIICVLLSCQSQQGKKKELTEDQKQHIINEVDSLWNYGNQGIVNLEAHKAFSIFSSDENAKYLRNNHLYESIKAAEEQYSEWFNNSPPGRRELSFDPILYDVISEDIVILTALGTLVYVDTTNAEIEANIRDTIIWHIGYTVLWRKEINDWKVYNMHTSL